MRKAMMVSAVALLGAALGPTDFRSLGDFGSLPQLAAGTDKEKQEETAGTRYGVHLDLDTYPQGKPQETLASVLKAIADKRPDYMVAQLSDPAFIDYRIKTFGGRFADQVEDTRARLDPATVKLLQHFLKDGDWQVADKEAMVLLKDVKDRSLFFQKSANRWFLLHRSKPASSAKPDH